MAVLSHGDEGEVYGTDGVIAIKKLVEPLKSCRTLHGKPKLFIVQVCVDETFISGSELKVYSSSAEKEKCI